MARQDAVCVLALNAVDTAFAANRSSIAGGDENEFTANHASITASTRNANHVSIAANHASMPGGGEDILGV